MPVLAEEPRQVVDVAVGVVAGDPVAEPEDRAHPEEVPEAGLDLGPGEPRIAVRVQEARLGRQEEARAR